MSQLYLLYRMELDGDIEENLDYKVGLKGRSILLGDIRHLGSVLKGVKTPYDGVGKAETLLNFLRFHEYSIDGIISLDDPGPAMHEINQFFSRKISK
jgi:hypothetical protein